MGIDTENFLQWECETENDILLRLVHVWNKQKGYLLKSSRAFNVLSGLWLRAVMLLWSYICLVPSPPPPRLCLGPYRIAME